MVEHSGLAKSDKWFDRDLAALIAFFACLWLLIGTVAVYAYPVFVCLNIKPTDSRAVCGKAMELPLIPSPLRYKARAELIAAHVYFEENEKALALIADQLKEGPATAAVLTQQAQLLRTERRFDEASSAYAEVLKFEPANETAAQNIVTMALENSQFDKARTAAEAFVKINPESSSIISWQGWIEHRDGKHLLALSFYDRAIALTPENAWNYRDVADIKLALDKPFEAIEHLSKAIELSPDDAYHLEKRAEVYAELGEQKLSQTDYEKSLTINRNATTLITLGRSYTDTGEYDQALGLIDEAIQQNYEIELALASKVRLFVRRGDYDGARNVIDELLKKDSNTVEAKYWAAVILHEQRRYEEALVGFQTLLIDAPNYTEAKLDAGNALIELDRRSEGFSYFSQVIADWPKSSVGFAHRARAHFIMGNWWATVSDANQSIKLKPVQGVSYAYRGLAWAKLGKAAEAKVSLETAALNEPTLEWVQRDTLDFLVAANLYSEALAVLTRLRSNLPQSQLIVEYEGLLRARGVKLP